jgi:hypothetical protein
MNNNPTSEKSKIEENFNGYMHIIRAEAGKNQLKLIAKIMNAFRQSLNISESNTLPVSKNRNGKLK